MTQPPLGAGEFPAFFRALNGVEPFPWQVRLARQVAETGRWPALFDLPTGSGKTATIDVAVFQLALEAGDGPARRAPVRIAFVVDRRLVVDDAFARAKRIADALGHADPDSVVGRAAARLRHLAVSAYPEAARAVFAPPPLVVRRLRGGIPREDDWASSPVQPTVVCSTVDQVGSRLLFRGYGVGDAAKPIHAGLIGSDCRILLDEAHLAQPFRQTLGWVEYYRGPEWREAAAAGPWGVSVLTAMPGATEDPPFALDAEDRADPTLAARLEAAKPALLIAPAKAKDPAGSEAAAEDEDEGEAKSNRQVERLLAQALKARDRLLADGVERPAVGVVVNRVKRARQVFDALLKALAADAEADVEADAMLLIGPARPVDRDSLAARLDPIRTGAGRDGLTKPLFLVATQCIEAGVDIDLDGLVSEAAPLDALRQRFGRLNRAGRPIRPVAAIVAGRPDLSARGVDAVYGTAIRETWAWLARIASPGAKGEPPTVDFGIEAFRALTAAADKAPPAMLLAPKADAPVLMPAHLDLLRQTWPVPAAGPDVGLYLHGPDLQPAAVTVVWRADLADGDPAEAVRRRLLVMPPRSAEAIELPLGAVRAWLGGRTPARDPLADLPQPEAEEGGRGGRPLGLVFRWAGDDPRSDWIDAAALKPGAMVVVPCAYGGVDVHGWNPAAREAAADVADAAALPFAGRRYAVRIAPGLLDDPAPPSGADAAERDRLWEETIRIGTARAGALAAALAAADLRDKAALWRRLAALDLPNGIARTLERLDSAKGGWPAVEVHGDLYGFDDEGRPRGIVLVATRGLKAGSVPTEDRGDATAPSATEDDVAGSVAAIPLRLDRHGCDVAAFAEGFARTAGLDEALTADLRLAGLLHDLGKADPRFQAKLRRVDPRFLALLGGASDLLAKSTRPLPRDAGALLPLAWRHEALSVRLAPGDPAFAAAADPDLVLWLIGTHHGRGRPFFPHADGEDGRDRDILLLDRTASLPRGPGPQSLAYDRDGGDWAQLFETLTARYGAWELARLEAILRLADHRASEWAERRGDEDEGAAASGAWAGTREAAVEVDR